MIFNWNVDDLSAFASLVTGFGDTASNLYGYYEDAHDDGARAHTNSWGDDVRGCLRSRWVARCGSAARATSVHPAAARAW